MEDLSRALVLAPESEVNESAPPLSQLCGQLVQTERSGMVLLEKSLQGIMDGELDKAMRMVLANNTLMQTTLVKGLFHFGKSQLELKDEVANTNERLKTNEERLLAVQQGQEELRLLMEGKLSKNSHYVENEACATFFLWLDVQMQLPPEHRMIELWCEADWNSFPDDKRRAVASITGPRVLVFSLQLMAMLPRLYSRLAHLSLTVAKARSWFDSGLDGACTATRPLMPYSLPIKNYTNDRGIHLGVMDYEKCMTFIRLCAKQYNTDRLDERTELSDADLLKVMRVGNANVPGENYNPDRPVPRIPQLSYIWAENSQRVDRHGYDIDFVSRDDSPKPRRKAAPRRRTKN